MKRIVGPGPEFHPFVEYRVLTWVQGNGYRWNGEELPDSWEKNIKNFELWEVLHEIGQNGWKLLTSNVMPDGSLMMIFAESHLEGSIG